LNQTAVLHPRFPNVFSPVQIGPVTVPNRIFMCPHGIPLEVRSQGGDVASEPALNRVHYFGERAAGGVGLIIHSTQVLSSQSNFGESPNQESSIPAYKAVADEVHKHGSKIFAEIWYVNWIQKAWERLGPEAPALAPSALPTIHYPSIRRAMTKRDITLMTDAFRKSARHLRTAGYDGIELHVSHGALIEYFLSPYFNRRTDEYGGSLENRARLMIEVLRAIKEELSDDQALGIRINADELLPGGLDEEATKDILRHLETFDLVDFIDLDISVEPEQVHLMTTGMFDPVHHNAARCQRVAEAIKSAKVLMTPGRLTNVGDAEKLISAGRIDMVGAVRGLIADPQMVNKSRDGKDGERRICVALNACVDQLGVGWGCAINASAGREQVWRDDTMTKVPSPKKVVVIGAGPAGLEVARVAAARGNQVTVLERNSHIGGAVSLWGKLPGRETMRTLPNYFKSQLSNLDIDLRLGVDATPEIITDMAPDVAVIATGSRYNPQGIGGLSLFPLPGHDLPNVHTPEAIINGAVHLSGKVAIIDDEGYHTACGLAEFLTEQGCEVVYVARKMVAGASLGLAIGYVATRLRSAGIKTITGHQIKAIEPGSVKLSEVMSGAELIETGIDHVVLSMSRETICPLFEALDGKLPYVYTIGDALTPRGLREATYEGHRFGRLIGELDMPDYVSDALFAPDNALRLVSAAGGV
jgi:2,4-dienoyl-CoA reductase-like NADH-dependent reductase (Old Yellow Enzyme family)/thioredoxin reductase